MTRVKITNSFLENDEENITFLYTGKSNIIGLKHFDSSIKNRSNYQYIRIGQIIPDEKALATDFIVIDELLSIVLSNDNNEPYSIASNVYITGILKNRGVVDDTFKCICTPLNNSSDNMTIYLVKEPTNGIMRIGIWVKTENYKKVYTNITASKAQNTAPINEQYLDSLYKIELLKDTDDITFNDNSSNDSILLMRNLIASSKNIYSDILGRLDIVERVAAPKFQYGYIVFPEDFIPDYSRVDNQILPPRSINYTTEFPFLKVNIDRNTVSAFENGIYQFNLTTGITGGQSFATSGKVNMGLYINDDKIAISNIDINIDNQDDRTITSAVYVQRLTPTDKISVKFKFDTPCPDSIIFKNTYLSVFRVQ